MRSRVRGFNAREYASEIGAIALTATSVWGMYLAKTSSQPHAEEYFLIYTAAAFIGIGVLAFFLKY